MKKTFLLLILVAFAIKGIAQVADSIKRHVILNGASNFRDLGGYKTTSGKTVMWGKVYRSGDISKLSEADLKLLADKHIIEVVDFRGNDEVAKAKDRLPANAVYLQLPAGSENVNKIMASLPKLATGDSLMISFYSQTAHLKAKYKPFFQELLKMPDANALLFHCSAGKDRTGIGAAMLLYVLGVPENAIMEDYLATNIYRKAENEKMVKIMMQMGIKEQAARDMTSVKPEYLNATYTAIVNQYGSIDKFTNEALGLTTKDIALLRKKYTY